MIPTPTTIRTIKIKGWKLNFRTFGVSSLICLSSLFFRFFPVSFGGILYCGCLLISVPSFGPKKGRFIANLSINHPNLGGKKKLWRYKWLFLITSSVGKVKKKMPHCGNFFCMPLNHPLSACGHNQDPRVPFFNRRRQSPIIRCRSCVTPADNSRQNK